MKKSNLAHAVLKKLTITIFELLLVIFSGSHARAAAILCTPVSGLNFSPAVNSQVFGRDAAVGSTSQPFSTLVDVSCTSDPAASHSFSLQVGSNDGVAVPGVANTLQTNIAGIGVQYYFSSDDGGTTCKPYSGGFPAYVSASRRNIDCTIPKASADTIKPFSLRLSVVFVKTASTPTGTLSKIPTVYIETYYDSTKTLVPWTNAISGTATGIFAIAACTVTTTSIAVTMPKTYTYRLPTVGSTDGETSLNIGLNCDQGVKVFTTLTDVSNPNNQTTTLSLSPDSTAQGIGYQILFGGVPAVFGPDSAVVANPGQVLINPAQTTGGVITVPLTARYIRTGKVSTGSANGKATFTMSYQ
jgi:type 1 fimbria pilin